MKFVSLGFIGHNFGDYKNEGQIIDFLERGFIGHNFGDYKNRIVPGASVELVLSATILETTKTNVTFFNRTTRFYRPQFWRLQKPQIVVVCKTLGEPTLYEVKYSGLYFTWK